MSTPGAAGALEAAPTGEPDPPEPVRGAGGALVLFSDVACPWATVMVLRLRAARARLGLEAAVPLIHLANPLELLHRHPLTRRVIDAEILLCAAAAPDFGWSLWQGRLDEYPVSSLLAVDLDAGIARHAMIRQTATARAHAPGSCTGYLVLPDGTGCCNPGVTIRWTEPGIPRGVPVLQADERDVYVQLVAAAAGAGQTT